MTNVDTKESTQKRLDEIEKELKELRDSYSKMKAKWSIEKGYIQNLRQIKEDIEVTRTLAEKYEREGNLDKVAELRYGTIHDLEKKLAETKSNLVLLQENGKMLNEEVHSEHIASIVAKWTGIPISKMLETERTKLLKMEERLHDRLIGQEEAVVAVSNAIRRSRSGLQDANRPIGSFIFLGTTGVGKTEMARALADFLFDDENSLVRIDMSEYSEKFAVSRLIGAPPGYVGYEEGGQLTEAVRQRPYSVILLDEIEKAHSEVFNILLQLLDDGRLTDGKGRTVNFTNTIIVMTSNLGTEYIQEVIDKRSGEDINDNVYNEVKLKILEMLKKKLRPEFLNRVDEIILFKPLNAKEIKEIADLQFRKLKKKIIASGIEIQITDEALTWIGNIGYDINYGARPLKRAIQKYLSDPLAIKLLSSEIINGDKILIDTDGDGRFLFVKQ